MAKSHLALTWKAFLLCTQASAAHTTGPIPTSLQPGERRALKGNTTLLSEGPAAPPERRSCCISLGLEGQGRLLFGSGMKPSLPLSALLNPARGLYEKRRLPERRSLLSSLCCQGSPKLFIASRLG